MGIYGVLRKTKVDEDEPESVLLQKEVGGLMIISSFVYLINFGCLCSMKNDTSFNSAMHVSFD